MPGMNNYPVVTNADSYFRETEKRLMHQERRPQIRNASDLLGPGFGPYGVQIEHWNANEATFNGTFWTAPGDTGAPDLTHYWIGQVTASDDGFGIQRILSFHDSAYFPPRTAQRQFYNPGNDNVLYSAWDSQHAINNDDPGLFTQGDAGGRGQATISGDGTVSMNGLAQEFVHREMDAGQSIPDGTNTVVRHWNTVVIDSTHWSYDDTSGDFTCVIPGTWLIIATVKYNNTAADDDGARRLFFDKNPGITFGQGPIIQNTIFSDTFVNAMGVIQMTSPGQVLNVVTRQEMSGGASVSLLSGGDTMLQMARLSA